MIACATIITAVNGQWSEWTPGECSVTCGVGKMVKSRTCDNPPPVNGGMACDGLPQCIDECVLDECARKYTSSDLYFGYRSSIIYYFIHSII